MTAKKISEECAKIGQKIAAETVRKDWTKGAPRTSPEAYLRWREKNIGKGTAPDVKEARHNLILEQTQLTRIRKESESIELQRVKDELWSKAEVLAARKTRMAKIRAVLDGKLRVELPAKLAGQPAEVIESGISSALDAAYAEIATA